MDVINYDVKFNCKTEKLEFRPYYESGEEVPEMIKQVAIVGISLKNK